ncbi:MAG: [FeFe] hydrogenase H-cluster radical SAM maturase HydE [Campylobacteraceae bacterium]|nr:[FeFe] hydrogenase H-cluster radical SAM maturase HydE [Campylobacteraceae bacterium]
MAEKTHISNLIKKAYETHSLSLDECTEILKSKSCDNELFEFANLARIKFSKESVHLKALIEISNYCKNSCFYCGLRKQNRNVKRYKLTKEQILSTAKEAVNLGYKTIVLQSGESRVYSTSEMCEIISSIHNFGARVTLSLGEKSFDEYKAYKEAGANRYLLRIETTDANLYSKLHPKMSHKNRFLALENLQKLGYETGSGMIVGFPCQDERMIAKDILYFKEQNFDMIGVGPFIPCENTPLANFKTDSFLLSLKAMAIIRLLMPEINIPATTAMETLCQNGRTMALQSGANVVMPAVAEYEYRKDYLIYPNKVTQNCALKEQILEVSSEVLKAGFSISDNHGDSVFFENKQRKVYE